MVEHLLSIHLWIVIVRENLSFATHHIHLFEDVGRISTSSDDDIYQTLAHAYANRILNFNENCKGEFQNKGFITRGADWYEILGGMQDYGYFNYGTIELTMEISCCKYPTSNLLLSYWNYNRDSMVELLYQAQRGQIDRIELNELCFYRCERFDIE